MDDITESENLLNDKPKHITATESMDALMGRYKARNGTTNEPDEAVLADLLTDLMHWAVENNVDFQVAVERAEGDFEAETPYDDPEIISEWAWDQAQLPDDIPLDATNVVVSAQHRRVWDDPNTYGPFPTGWDARRFVVERYRKDWDQEGCEVEYSVLVAP